MHNGANPVVHIKCGYKFFCFPLVLYSLFRNFLLLENLLHLGVHSGTDPSVHLTPKLKNRYHPLVAILLFEVTRGTL